MARFFMCKKNITYESEVVKRMVRAIRATGEPRCSRRGETRRRKERVAPPRRRRDLLGSRAANAAPD